MKTTDHYPTPVLKVLLLALLFSTSCKDSLDVGMPKTELAAQAVFESDATAQAALSSIYVRSATFTAGGTGSVTNMGAFLADEADNYATSLAMVQLATNQLISTNTYTSGLWNGCYETIYQSSLLIEGLTDNPKISTAVARQLTGEALVLRALAQSTLASLYGDVPIVNQTDYRINALLPRSPVAEVYDQAISDLERAKPLLTDSYTSFASERIRATRWAASALVARVYLYKKDYARARAESSLVIDASTLFSLTPLADVFLKNSKEAILQYRTTSTSINTSEGSLFILTAKPGQLALSNAFYSGFEAGDQRKTAWIGKFSTGGTDYYFPYKYKVKTGSVLTEYSMLLRLGEQYLIRAEASARLDDLAQAAADLDAIRQRASLPKLSSTIATSKDLLLDAVLKERKAELFTEWAHRWVDLQRFAKATTVLPLVKPDWKPSAQLLPVPDYDIRTNPNLSQNPGY